MFWPDIVYLKEFYALPEGQRVARSIGDCVRSRWGNTRGEKILGIGFAAPFLSPFIDEAERVMALMPAAQGAMYWPPSRPNRTFLAHEAQIPLPDNSINRLLLAHVLENSQHLGALVEEAWRVLVPGGKLLAVAANRRGLWARSTRTPFSYGQPFSPPQLRKVFSENKFTCGQDFTCVFTPPGRSALLHRWSHLFEKIGLRCFSGFGGVVVLEAEKQLYAVRGDVVKASARPQVYVPAAKPAMTFRWG